MKSIIVEFGGRKKISLIAKKLGTKCLVLHDSNLKKMSVEIEQQLQASDMPCARIEIAPGESGKSFRMVEKTCRAMVKKGFGRDSVLIGVGGGVITDVAGFIASIYMRGIPFIAVPTTVLGMADAGIGGKNGINLPEGKNLVGTFRNPNAVIMDIEFLETLPQRVFNEGLAEIVKHGVIADQKLFSFLEKNIEKILARDRKIVERLIKKSVAIKLKIVADDPKENFSRMLLNFGHTVGHALENLSRYKLLHGEAISIGMVAECGYAVAKKMLRESEAARVQLLLSNLHLPVELPKYATPRALQEAMMKDKKIIRGQLRLALPTKIGSAKIVTL